MSAKDRHKAKLIEFISDPENESPNRNEMAAILKLNIRTLYNHFTPDELHNIEKEGLEERRKKYAPLLSKADKALLDRAASGDPQACKLAYQRFEGWSERQIIDASVKVEPPALVVNVKSKDNT